MRRALSNWSRPPRSLRRLHTRLDNLALVPASELGSLESWQHASQQLPAGDLLVVVPSDNLQLLEVGRSLDRVLREQGRKLRLTTIPSSPRTSRRPART
jgi:hypothetical protein